MAEKILNSRLIMKHDTPTNWGKASTMVPKQGELIIYDTGDATLPSQFKIGDGTRTVGALPFANISQAATGGSSLPVYWTGSGFTAISTLGVANGGTGATTAAAARSNLGITLANLGAASSSHSHTLTDLSGTLSVAKGGTGATDAATARSNLGITLANLGAAASSHTHSAYVNQNAFSNVTIGDTTVSADTTTDTLTLVAGSNITLTPDATNDKITITATNSTYTLAGLMGSSAKGSTTQPVYWTGSTWANTSYTLGASVPSGAKFTDTVYTLPTASSTLGGVKTTSSVTSNSGYTACPIIDGVVYYKDTNTTYTLSGLGGVPTSRTINGKALSANISLTASDVGAAASSHTHSTYVNQNAFSNISVNSSTISADTTTDTLTLVAGDNITLTPDTTNDKITIAASTSSSSGYSGDILYGGATWESDVDPICAALISAGANRAAFCDTSGITIEYSNNNGSSWTDYGSTIADKTRLVSNTATASFLFGKNSSTPTASDQLRISVNASTCNFYTPLKYLAIYMTDCGATCQVKVERAINGSTSYETVGTYKISGWSGWNSIPLDCTVGGGVGRTDNYGTIRCTFSISNIGSCTTAPRIHNISFLSYFAWTAPSNLSATGNIYQYDVSQNVTFPAKVTATYLGGTLSYSLSLNGKTFNNTSSIDMGTLGIAYGGTGATTKATARTNLGISSGTSLPSSGTAGDIFLLYS